MVALLECGGVFFQDHDPFLGLSDFELTPEALITRATWFCLNRGRDHHRDGINTKAKSTIHLVTASDWKDNNTYAFENHDLLFSEKPYPGGVEDPVRLFLSLPLSLGETSFVDNWAQTSSLIQSYCGVMFAVEKFVYKDKRGNYHAIFHLLYNTRPADDVCANEKFLGGHAFSKKGDGIHWTFTGVAYDGNVS